MKRILLFLIMSTPAVAQVDANSQDISERVVADAIPVVAWLPHTFTLSPDSHRTAYVIDERLNEYSVVLDNKRGKTYDCPIGEMHWSPDSRHLVYEVLPKVRVCTFLVVDNEETRKYDRILTKTISFMGNDTLRFLAVKGSKVVSVDMLLP